MGMLGWCSPRGAPWEGDQQTRGSSKKSRETTIRGWESTTHKERLEELRLFSLARRRLRRAADNGVRGRCEEDGITAPCDPGAGTAKFWGREKYKNTATCNQGRSCPVS